MRVQDSVHSDHMPPSAYVATCNDLSPFGTMKGDERVDVCIIGGGYTGVAAALMLAQQGSNVVLLEQNQIGWGASGRNGGQVIGGYGQEMADLEKIEKTFGKKNVDAVFGMGVECVDIVKGWVKDHGIDCDLVWGYYDAAMNQRELDELVHTKDAMQANGYPHEQRLVTGAEGREIVNSDQYIGGMVNMGWGHCHPLNLLRGEARVAEKLGARLYEGVMVTGLDMGKTVKVRTEKGVIEADQVIIGANAYLGHMFPKLASRVLPVGSYIIATEPLSQDLADEVMPANFAACNQKWALDYFRLSADRRMLFGGRANYSGLHPRDLVKNLQPRMVKVFPQLKDVKVEFSWGGYLGIGLNRIPQLGKLADNVYYAQAYAGHGVAPTHMSARLMVEAINGNTSRFDIMAGVWHPPFPGGRYLRQPILAAGMAYYKMRDALGV